MTKLATVLGDLLRAALDDCRVRLPPLTERKILSRMVELAECMGIEVIPATPEPQPADDPTEWSAW